MKDKRICCERFENIVRVESGKVAIYGLGKYAEMVGECVPEKIACFCDKDCKVKEFFGKPVKPLLALPKIGIKTIVIATSFQVEQIIYDRIAEFCKKNKMALYALHAVDLSKVGRLLPHAMKDGDEQKEVLYREIKQHEVISFDIFDTLVMRRTLYPTDVFDIVEYRAKQEGIHLLPDFKNYRHQAEVGRADQNSGLSGIYHELIGMIGITETEAKQLMEIELQVEREVIVPRPSMVQMFHYAKSLRKRVILVSDMYLPVTFLQEVLADCGIIDFDAIYVSENCGIGKTEDLFLLVHRECSAKSYLHIGDNFGVDGWGARSHGMDAFLIKSAVDMFREAGLSQPFKYRDSLNERLIVGLFLERAYADPFCLDREGKRSVNSMVEFASLFIAPLAVEFIIWLIHRVEGKDFSAVLFAARDGYVFQQMYEEVIKIWNLSNMPRGLYLYASRKLCLGLAMNNENDLKWMCDKLQRGTRNFIQDVFEIRLVDTGFYDSKSVWQSVYDHRKEIFQFSKKERCGYLNYLSELGVQPYEKYAFFDLCSQGTSQHALESAVLPNLYGFYIQRCCTNDTVTMGCVESFLLPKEESMLFNNAFEFVFSSSEPSVRAIEENGKIIFGQEIRTADEIQESCLAQEEVKKFLREFLLLGFYPQTASKNIGRNLLDICAKKEFPCNKKVLSYVISDDLFNVKVPVFM